MVGLKERAQWAFFRGLRGLAALFPPSSLYYLLLPYSAVRGIRPARRERNVPVSAIPARSADPRPSFVRRWRFQTAIHQRWLMLLWTDRWDAPRWAGRFTADGMDVIDALKASRPIIVVTVHTEAFLVLGGWLMHQGLGVGSVVMNRRRWRNSERARARTASIWNRFGDSAAFPAGDTRALLRYLQPGRCVVLAPDHTHGRTVEGTWSGGRLEMANGAFRLARMSGAAVVPVVVTDEGPWRFRIHVGPPVPDALIAADDVPAAASHVAQVVMAIVAARPDQAAVTLVRAASPPAGQASAG